MTLRPFAKLVVAILLIASLLPAFGPGGEAYTFQGSVSALPPENAPHSALAPPSEANPDPNAFVRVIIRLEDEPLASYRGTVSGLRPTAPQVTGAPRIDVNATASQDYLAYLAGKQSAFVSRLAGTAPGARADYRFRIALNGIAAKVRQREIAAIRALPGVTAVTVEREYRVNMDASVPLIGLGSGTLGGTWADAGLWAAVGGHSNAGQGIKVADIDSGLSYGNPCFAPSGYSFPAGFPKFGTGFADFVNPKVITARAYFRVDDPPAFSRTPADDPIEGGGGHGTHTAGTIACNYGTPTSYSVDISGVAPKAQLMVYRAFYRGVSGSDGAGTPELIQAVEDAVADGADVINNSWGATALEAVEDDPLVRAFGAAVDAGVVVVFANGNAGPNPSTVGSPAIGTKFISVGASATGRTFTNTLSVTGPVTATPPVTLTAVTAIPSGDGPPVTATITSTYKFDAGNALGCSAYPAGAFAGQIALISRGACPFVTKVGNAASAGAIAVVVAQNTGDSPFAMGGLGGTTVPAVMVAKSDGDGLINWYNLHPGLAQARLSTPNRSINAGSTDTIAGFSSRGPTPNLDIKPDITAPGVDTLSATSGGSGFTLLSGTSMATPHVTGAAALLRQLHPTWTPGQIKSALMTTAAQPGSLGSNPNDRGAGRMDLSHPNDPGLTFDNPSLSFGLTVVGNTYTRTVTARDVSGQGGTYTVSATASSGGFTPTVPPSITVAPNGTATFNVVLSAGAAGDAYGNINLSDGTTSHTLHIPYWTRRRVNLGAADVLLIDDDNSDHPIWGPGCPNVSSYYTQTLTNLGLTYALWNWDTTQSFDFDQARRYSKVVYFSGACGGDWNNQLDDLRSYMASGGRMLITGQNLGFFDAQFGLGLGLFFGAEFLQDSLYPISTTVPAPAVQGDSLFSDYLSGQYYDIRPTTGNGARNQVSVDEVQAAFDTSVDAQPILTTSAVTTTLGLGHLGTRLSSEPTIDRVKGEASWTPLSYRTEFLSFGLEGVNNDTGFNTREQLMDRLLSWLDDRVTVTLASPSYIVTGTNVPLLLRASASTSITTTTTGFANQIVAYRWDFGDGTPIQTTTTSSAVHGYRQEGRYLVRVEATDRFGHKAVSEATPVTVGNRIYFPMVGR